MELLRSHIGQCLRTQRISQNRTLRDVAKAARVSLGYLSEVERARKKLHQSYLMPFVVHLICRYQKY